MHDRTYAFSIKSFHFADFSNDPKYLDRQVWANKVDPHLEQSELVYTVCHSICIFWTHYCI